MNNLKFPVLCDEILRISKIFYKDTIIKRFFYESIESNNSFMFTSSSFENR